MDSSRTVRFPRLDDYEVCVCPNCKGDGHVWDDRDVNGVAGMREHTCDLCDGVGDIHLTPAVASLLDAGGYDEGEIAMCHACGLVVVCRNECPLCARQAAKVDAGAADRRPDRRF